MNCPAWEERILRHLEGDGDPEAAAHLVDCPECAALAAELALDGRRLRIPPAEAAAVDYRAIRAAAGQEANRRRRRQRVLAVLATAAALLLASRLALHRDLPQTAHRSPARPPLEVARVAPPVAPAHAVRTPRATRPVSRRRRKPESDIDRQFADYLRVRDESRQPKQTPAADSPAVLRIDTTNPNVVIWLQEPKGNDHE